MKKILVKILFKMTGINQTINNLVAENNNLKRRLRELEGLNNFNRRF